MSIIRPDMRAASVADIDVGDLATRVKGVLIDIDDTILPDPGGNGRDDVVSPRIAAWLTIASNTLRLAIVSNTRNEGRARRLAERLGCPYVHLAYKPGPWGFRKALGMISLGANEVAVIGDRLTADILGGKLIGAYTVLVEPLCQPQPDKRRLLRWFESLLLA